MSVHLNLRNGKIRTDDKEDIVQTAAPAAQETAAQTSADYERQVRLNLKKGTVSYGGKSYGLSHEGTSNAGSQALQEQIDARSREQKGAHGQYLAGTEPDGEPASTEARQEETARQKVITMLAAGAAGLGSRSTGSARGTASSYLQGGGSTGGSAYAAALSAGGPHTAVCERAGTAGAGHFEPEPAAGCRTGAWQPRDERHGAHRHAGTGGAGHRDRCHGAAGAGGRADAGGQGPRF